ncbi:glycosyltransferase family 4 protein [Priestia aryabhattai]
MNKGTVYMWPKNNAGNKYNELLSNSVENSGVKVENFTKRKILKMKKNDVLHLHWPSFAYRGNSKLTTFIKSLLLINMFFYLKIKGINIVWTIHNLWPHSTGKRLWDFVMRRLIIKLCNKVILMGRSESEIIKSNLNIPHNKICFIPHGHYKGVYSSSGTDVRKDLSIPDENFVFGFLGQVSPYKGVEDLLRAFKEMPNANINLIIAGRVSKDFNKDIFKEVNDSRICLKLHFIEDDQIVDYLNAFDCMVLPYKKVTTSGSAILALSYNVPIVAPSLGLIQEYVPEGCGVLYNPTKSNSLKEAMVKVIDLDKRKFLNQLTPHLERLDWNNLSRDVIGIYSNDYKKVKVKS